MYWPKKPKKWAQSRHDPKNICWLDGTASSPTGAVGFSEVVMGRFKDVRTAAEVVKRLNMVTEVELMTKGGVTADKILQAVALINQKLRTMRLIRP